MKFRPCIDIHNGKVKQIVGGTLTDSDVTLVENFSSNEDAAHFANLYKEHNLYGGHVIMLGPGNKDQAVKALNAFSGGLQVGGGITLENAEFFLEQGASHVIVTSFVFKDGKINFHNLDKLVSLIGKNKLVLDLSCRKKDGIYFVVTDRWQKFTTFEITEKNIQMLSNYCDEFLIHAADVEGKCQGIEHNLIKQLGSWVAIPTTYAGGIHSLTDLNDIFSLGHGNIDYTIGSALDIFGGKISFQDIVNWKPI